MATASERVIRRPKRTGGQTFKYSKTLLLEINDLIELGNIKLLNRLLRIMFTNYMRHERNWVEDDFDEMLTELGYLFYILDKAEDEYCARIATYGPLER